VESSRAEERESGSRMAIYLVQTFCPCFAALLFCCSHLCCLCFLLFQLPF
jgi:hypothetical protein